MADGLRKKTLSHLPPESGRKTLQNSIYYALNLNGRPEAAAEKRQVFDANHFTAWHWVVGSVSPGKPCIYAKKLPICAKDGTFVTLDG